MPNIIKVKLKWTGFSGAPGYTNFFYRDEASGAPSPTTATDAVTKVGNFANYIKAYLPIETAVQVQSDIEVIEETNGQLQDVMNVASQPVVQGTAPSAPYSAASGAVITWRTAGVRNGRRVRGRTFLVPLANSAYQSDGTIASAALTALNTNMGTFLDATGSAILGVYARPTSKGATDGAWFTVIGHNIPDKVAVLRSRRD
jgi:hypothetical protein